MRYFTLLLVALAAGCRLDITASPNGKISAPSIGYECDDSCRFKPPPDFDAEFMAIPDENYRFAGWSGDICHGATHTRDPVCRIFVNEEIAEVGATVRMTARFTRIMAPGSARDTEEFAITNFGFGSFYTEEVQPVTCYPNLENCTASGVTFISPHNYATGDFNADGYQDLIVQPAMNNGYIRQQRPGPVIYLNDKSGGLYRADNMFAKGESEEMLFGYRMAVEDFNGDGRDDFIVAPMGILSREPDTYLDYFPERIPLYLSGADGKLHDASAMIAGQENGSMIPDMGFAHDLATGDIDGDGDIDIFLGEVMLINNGDGSFVRGVSLANRDEHISYVMSSLIDDFDSDGIGDLAIFYGDGNNVHGARSDLYLSNGQPGLEQRVRKKLPRGFFGLFNSKHNHAASGDIDGDGDADIVVGVTRAEPYYAGRAVQLFINDGAGGFTDNTKELIEDQSRYTRVSTPISGEGFVRILDFNGDGALDIFDRRGVFHRETNDGPVFSGAGLFLNDGTGKFVSVPDSAYPVVETRDLLPFDGTEVGFYSDLQDPAPIDLDGKNGLDLVTYAQSTSYPAWDFSEATLYTLTSKKKLKAKDFKAQ